MPNRRHLLAITILGTIAYTASGTTIADSLDSGVWTATMPKAPKIPTFEQVQVGREIADSRHEYLGYIPLRTENFGNANSGYQVIGPNGETFVVDNIEEPKCALYATYIETGDSELNASPPIIDYTSNVYIEEVNFENCQ